MSFQISDKVMQIENRGPWDHDPSYDCPAGDPVDGVVYVVSDICADRDNGPYGLRLVGLPCYDLKMDHVDAGWSHEEFRKLSEVQAESRLRAEQPEPALQG